jgi:hypothetical protein
MKILPQDLSFTFAGDNLTFLFRGQEIGRESVRRNVKAAAQATIAGILEGRGYDHELREIREILENRVFPLTYASFDAYVLDWPEAEKSRARLTNSGKRAVHLFQSQGPYNTMPGGYLWMCLVKHFDGGHVVSIIDNDDGAISKEVASETEGNTLVEQVLSLAPVNMDELKDLLGFTF